MERSEMQARRMELHGVVVSNKMEKTLVVAVERSYRHPRLHKVIRTVKTYKAHYEGDARAVAPGTKVSLREGRPISKTKFMYVTALADAVGGAS